MDVKNLISIRFDDIGGLDVIAVLGNYDGKFVHFWSILDELVQTSFDGRSLTRDHNDGNDWGTVGQCFFTGQSTQLLHRLKTLTSLNSNISGNSSRLFFGMQFT